LLAEIGLPPGGIQVRAQAGAVTVDGELDRRSRVDVTVRAVQALPGVVGVHNNLRYLVDDVVVAGSGGGTGFSL
jgi:osmotically-inducible protein OsmY